MAALVATAAVAALAPVNEASAQAAIKLLPITAKRQNTLVWCWAASIAMVVEYFTRVPTQDCEVLAKYDASLGGPGACCIRPVTCNRASMPAEIGAILGRLYNLHGTILPRALTWDEYKSHIDARRPVIAWIWNSPTTAHVVVLAGYEDGPTGAFVHVLDPMRGPLRVPPNQMGQLGNWNLTWTFDLTTPPP